MTFRVISRRNNQERRHILIIFNFASDFLGAISVVGIRATVMKYLSVVVLLYVGALLPAHADTFNWSDTDGDTGTVTATNDGSGEYTVLTMSGSFNAATITGLIGTSPGFGGNDNLLFCSVTGCSPDSDGIAFSTADGDEWRYYMDGYSTFVSDYDGYYIYGTETITSCGYVGCSDYLDFTPASTPLPAALPLFGTVLGVGGLLGWRRKRKYVAAVSIA